MKQLKGLILFLIFFLTFASQADAGKVVPLIQLEKPNSITVLSPLISMLSKIPNPKE